MEKTGLLHCTKKNTRANPDVRAPDGTIIKATPHNQSLRWLGLYLDRQLTFKKHIEQAAAIFSRATNGMRLLAGCFKGTASNSMLNIIRACIQPQLTYAASAWWPVPANKRRIATVADKLDVSPCAALRAAPRAALPVYRTTQKHLHHGGSYPPVELILDDILTGGAIHIALVDGKHMLHRRHIDGRID